MALAVLVSAITVSNDGPCDIFARGGTPCVAAHSTTRAMYAVYSGPLYSVRRRLDNATTDIPAVAPGGPANASVVDAYCEGAALGCTIAVIYDQSGHGNHLRAGPGRRGHVDLEVNATADPHTLLGRKVYSAYFEPVDMYPGAPHPKEVGVGYRNDNTTGVAKGDEPETLYAVMSGTHYNNGCCFDYGNAETGIFDAGDGTMEAISITADQRGTMHGSHHGAGPGPWVFGDLEQGLFVGNNSWPAPSLRDADNNTFSFVTAMIKGDGASPAAPLGHWAIKGGDATAAAGLRTLYDGPRPCAGKPPACINKGNQSWSPMRKFGGLILGIGGDNSHGGVGTFFEGALTQGYSTDATDAALQANIAAAGYGKYTTP